MAAYLLKLVLIEDIPRYEEDGWQLTNRRVHVNLGGWHSVYMRKVEE